MTSKQTKKLPEPIAARVGNLRDLSDFCQIWPELREFIIVDDLSVSQGEELDRAIVRWLVLLADRVCASDEL